MFNKLPRAKIVLLSFFAFFVIFSFGFSSPREIFASETEGTIDGTFKNAWGENIGWLNFGCDECDVLITDDTITGLAWSSQFGWINLNPTASGVSNDGEGVLSGFAWSSNLGWIDFDGVTINDSGEFLGYATVRTGGSQINFNCVNGNSCSSFDFKVKTDWRPASVRGGGGQGGDEGGSGGRKGSNSGGGIYEPPVTPPEVAPNPFIPFYNPFLGLFKPPVKPEAPVIVEVPEIAPVAFQLRWNLLPVEAIRSFVFAPLPYEVRILAAKFPELDRTLQSVGIKRLTDLSKVTGVSLNLPGLSELTNTLRGVNTERLSEIDKLKGVGLNLPGLSPIGGKITLIQGIPLAQFSSSAKKSLPAEFVFARAAGELVDLNVVLSIGDRGEVTQTISTLPGKTMRLVVKPIGPARNVTGYFVFKSATPKVAENPISRASLSASALLSMNDLVENVSASVPVENALVLSSFEYTDPDHDGIYTADVVSPTTPGEYEVITVINYIDPVLGTRQIRMITVVDPEGYVFEKNYGKETRIPSAVVSLFVLNNSTKQYELWPAKNYSQENPQTTDVRGTYSFLVPEGSYYFEVKAPGYDRYTGEVFAVTEGAGVHQNIELKKEGGWLSIFRDFDLKTILLIVVILLLVYNLYRNRMREKLLRFSNKNE